MRAVTIVSPGGLDALEIREVQIPSLTSDRVRVRVRAAGLNRADILQRMGRYPAPPGYSQDIPGLEFAGEVDEVGDAVRSWARGDRVFGIVAAGAQAEYVVAFENHLARVPPNLDWANAAAVPEAFMTAYDALFAQARLQLGEAVLVHAAGSGVGTAAIQLARAAGATVYGTSRTKSKLEQAAQYGLKNYFVIQDEPSVFVDAVRDWTGGRGVNVILDLVGARYFEANISSLAILGRLMLVGTTSGSKSAFDIGAVMRNRITIKGTVLRARSAEEKATATRLFAEHVVPLLASGSVRPIIESVYPLEKVREAHELMEANKNFGKIVLEL